MVDENTLISLNFDVKFHLKSFLESIADRKELKNYEKEAVAESLKSLVISYNTIISVHQRVKYHVNCKPLWQILVNTTVNFPKIETVRNVEVEKRVKALKEKFANQEYRKMTSNLDPFGNKRDNTQAFFGQDIKCMNKHLIMVFNFVLVVCAAFVFGFYASGFFQSDEEEVSTATRLVFGFVCAIIVFFADLYFLLKNVNASENFLGH